MDFKNTYPVIIAGNYETIFENTKNYNNIEWSYFITIEFIKPWA